MPYSQKQPIQLEDFSGESRYHSISLQHFSTPLMKVIYKVHGSNTSWEWLAMISPCIDILRQLATQIHVELGSHQGSNTDHWTL